mgnify:CR=1 FL=1
MSAKFTVKVGAEDRLTIVLEDAEEAIPKEHIPCTVETYTFRAQDVYVSHSKRIRFLLKTYTFCSPNVYVAFQSGYTLSGRQREGGP